MYKTLWLMVIQVGKKWCKATTTWKFWWNFLAKSLVFSRYPIFSPFQCTDAYKCYTFSESCGSRETKEIKISISKFDLEARTGSWSDTASYMSREHSSYLSQLPQPAVVYLFAQRTWNFGLFLHIWFVFVQQLGTAGFNFLADSMTSNWIHGTDKIFV